MKPIKISIVLPAHNEQGSLENMVVGLLKRYRKWIASIIIVDDNSQDRTLEIAQNLARQEPCITVIHRLPPGGVGLALREGFQHIPPESTHVLMMDSDFVANLSEVSDLIEKAEEGYDVVFGSRYCWAYGFNGYPLIKRLANRIFHALVRRLLGIEVMDLTNNFKLIRADLLQKFDFISTDFSINAETGLYPLMLGCKNVEVPVKWVTRTASMGMSNFYVLKAGRGYWRVLSRCHAARKTGHRTFLKTAVAAS